MATDTVNNAIYFDMGERWYEADDDPVALLRAEARLHAPWIAAQAQAAGASRILDVGCGAGFIANDLARRGFDVVGVDVADDALSVALRHDTTRSVAWLSADARELPFRDASFDAVCAMDFLEHVEPIEPFVSEIARVLAPGGVFFFHTFNRTLWSWLVVIKGVELFVRNVPPRMHVLRSFVKPAELRAACGAHGLVFRELHGCAPRMSRAFARLVATGVVPRDFEFRFTRNTLTGYSGVAEKRV